MSQPAANSRPLLALQNRQRVRRLHLPLFRRIIRSALVDLLNKPEFNLAIYIVAAPEMTRLNETHLGHQGSTDVITFDYRGPGQPELLHGEIFVCIDEALLQARRFRTTWQSELVRYAVHGILHLCDFDDHSASDRRKMKQAENRLVRSLTAQFSLSRLAPGPGT